MGWVRFGRGRRPEGNKGAAGSCRRDPIVRAWDGTGGCQAGQRGFRLERGPGLCTKAGSSPGIHHVGGVISRGFTGAASFPRARPAIPFVPAGRGPGPPPGGPQEKSFTLREEVSADIRFAKIAGGGGPRGRSDDQGNRGRVLGGADSTGLLLTGAGGVAPSGRSRPKVGTAGKKKTGIRGNVVYPSARLDSFGTVGTSRRPNSFAGQRRRRGLRQPGRGPVARRYFESVPGQRSGPFARERPRTKNSRGLLFRGGERFHAEGRC